MTDYTKPWYNVEAQYLELLHKVSETGQKKKARTGNHKIGITTGDYLIYGVNGLGKGRYEIPLMRHRQLGAKMPVAEEVAFLAGARSTQELAKIMPPLGDLWSKWSHENGQLGGVYGGEYRGHNGHLGGCRVDQFDRVITMLLTHPYSSRIRMTTLNANLMPNEDMSYSENVEEGLFALAPCRHSFQFSVEPETKKLNIECWQSSVDVLIGLPHNIMQNAALMIIMCELTGYEPGQIRHNMTDIHVYQDQIDEGSVEEVLKRLEEVVYPELHKGEHIHNPVAYFPPISGMDFDSLYTTKLMFEQFKCFGVDQMDKMNIVVDF